MEIYQRDCIELLNEWKPNSVDLIYVDPPFGTGEKQELKTTHSTRNERGVVTGFGGKRYDRKIVERLAYEDSEDNYLSWTLEWLELSKLVLKDTGLIYIHLDYRYVHYVKILCDIVFGKENFVNEIIWAWDYGAKPKNRWPNKHNTILMYSKTENYYFNQDAVDRIPYMTPGLVTLEKAEQGKIPTSVWWFSIVGTNSYERTGYPTQKPEKLLNRIIATSCPENGTVMDFFAGSGTTGAVAKKLNRRCILVDNNPDAIKIIKERIGE